MSGAEVQLSQIGAFVPFPTALMDEQMPHLRDTEWRLLCVIVRQTVGWQSGKGRKKRDWMSQTQLMARTGRNSAALSAALDVLVRRNLIECSDVYGEPLITPQQRRRHRGRVYFALTSAILLKVAPVKPTAQVPTLSPADMNSVDRPRSRFIQRISNGWAKAIDVADDLDYTPKSEVRKAKRTKETQEQKKI